MDLCMDEDYIPHSRPVTHHTKTSGAAASRKRERGGHVGGWVGLVHRWRTLQRGPGLGLLTAFSPGWLTTDQLGEARLLDISFYICHWV